eukprot:8842462-Pyramimonas_sp.AAC.1
MKAAAGGLLDDATAQCRATLRHGPNTNAQCIVVYLKFMRAAGSGNRALLQQCISCIPHFRDIYAIEAVPNMNNFMKSSRCYVGERRW